jgi:hypothetical protein
MATISSGVLAILVFIVAISSSIELAYICSTLYLGVCVRCLSDQSPTQLTLSQACMHSAWRLSLRELHDCTYSLLVRVLVMVMFTLLARSLPKARYGALLAYNTFIAVALQAIITAVFDNALQLSTRGLFYVFTVCCDTCVRAGCDAHATLWCM